MKDVENFFMKKSLKKIAILAGAAAIGLSTAACSSSSATVVNYKGGKITQDDYYEAMKDTSSGQQTLVSLIIYRTLKQQYGDKVSSKKIDAQYNKYKKQYGSSFSTVLSYSGLTTKSFKQNLATNLYSIAALKDLKKPTDKQEKSWWASYHTKTTVQHIVVAKKSTAQTVISKLKSGTSFATLAKKYSTDTATKKKAGKLAAFDSTDTSLSSTFKNAVWKLKEGEYTTTPVKTSSGYEVIKVLKTTEKGAYNTKANKKFIDNQLYTKWASNSTVMTKIIGKVLKKADVNIKDKDLKSKNLLSSYLNPSSSTASSTATSSSN